MPPMAGTTVPYPTDVDAKLDAASVDPHWDHRYELRDTLNALRIRLVNELEHLRAKREDTIKLLDFQISSREATVFAIDDSMTSLNSSINKDEQAVAKSGIRGG